MISRISVGVMALGLVLYIVLVAQRAYIMLTSGTPVGIILGIGLVVLPLIGIWALVREFQFGVAASRLIKRLEAEGLIPDDDVALTPSGRVAREAAPALIARYEHDAATDSTSWRAALRLAIVQDAAGQRKDARASVRSAIRLARDAGE